MKLFLFSLKRTLRSPLLLALLALVILLPAAAARTGREVSTPDAAYVCLAEGDTEADRLTCLLKDFGFVRLRSVSALRSAVEEGSVDCGVVIPEDFSGRLRAGENDQILRFIDSPTSLMSSLYREQAAAALFSICAPYITLSALSDSGLSEEEIFDSYYELLQEGSRFSFELESAEGKLIVTESRADRFFLGALGLLLWIGSFYILMQPLLAEQKSLKTRIGRRRSITAYLLPGLFIRLLLAAAAALISLAIGGRLSLVGPVLLYLLLLTFYHLLLLSLPGENWQGILTAFEAALALALCPIFTDLGLLFPIVAKLRLLLPLGWLFAL